MMKANNIFEYKSTNYKEFLREFQKSNENKHALIVLAGAFTHNRMASLDEFKREVLGEVIEIDLREVITPYEEESYRNIDACLASIDENASLIIFKNSEQLSGAYTSFSISLSKYATPQEKYFLKKIKSIQKPIILEFKEIDEVDRMLLRKADAVILFKPPSSFAEKLAWKIQNIHVHGSRFLSQRRI
jgi:SpoVK/Ycf46/Vps4 family AAA+-type ATPase